MELKYEKDAKVRDSDINIEKTITSKSHEINHQQICS